MLRDIRTKFAALVAAFLLTFGVTSVTASAALNPSVANVTVGSTTASFTGTLGSDAVENKVVGIAYGRPGTGEETRVAGTVSGTSFSVSVSGLKPATTYNYYVYVKYNLTGQQTVSEEGTVSAFTTKPSAPTVTSSAALNTSSGQIEVVTSVTDNGGESPTKIGFVISSTKKIPEKDSDETTTVIGASESYTVSLTSDAGKTYYVRSFAENSGGIGYSDVTAVSVPTAATNAPTAETDAAAVGTSSIIMNGRVVDAGGTLIRRGFVVSYTNSTPRLTGSSVTDVQATLAQGAGSFTASFASETGKLVYIAAYAENSKGVAYGRTVVIARGSGSLKPTLDTVSTLSGKVYGTISNPGSSAVSERGFVYSTTNSTPTVGGTGSTKLSVALPTYPYSSDILNEFSAADALSGTGVKYYIRSYAINDAGTSYSTVLTVAASTSTAYPTVKTSSATPGTSSIALTGCVTNTGGGTITEWGFVYSTSNQTPVVSGSGVSKISAGQTITTSNQLSDFTATLSGTTSKVYYVRAYAKNALGYGYGSTFAVSYGTKSVPTLTASQSRSGSTVTMTGCITKMGNAVITARGFVYSTTNSSPTLSGSGVTSVTVAPSAYTDPSVLDEFTKSVTNSSTLYVRAYATNSYGTGYSSVAQSSSIPTVTYSASGSGTTITATVNVTNNGGGTITGRGIQYSKSRSTLLNNSGTSVAGSGTATSVSVSFTASKNTIYYLRAYATNSSGTAYSTDGWYVIGSCAPGVTTDSVTVSGTTISMTGVLDATGNKTVSERGFVYSTSTSSPTTSNGTKITASSSTTFSSTLTGSTGTKYYVRAFATNSEGTGYGSVINVTTSGYGAPAVKTVSVTSSGSTVSCSGQISSTGGATVTERGFVYSTSNSTPTTSNTTVKSSSSSTSYSGSFTGSSGYTYYVRAYAKNTYGTGYGDPISVTVSTGSVPTVKTKTVEASGTSISMTGELTSSGSSSVTERGFVYSTSTSSPTISDSTKIKSASNTTFSGSFTGSSGKKYYVRAYATNSYGTGYGSALTVTASSSGVPTVSTLSATASGTDITVSCEVDGSGITERGIVYSNTTKSPTTSSGTKKKYSSTSSAYKVTFEGDAEVKYYVRAYAINSSGTGYGETLTVTADGEPITVMIKYKDETGRVVKRQTLLVSSGQMLTSTWLSLPKGCKLTDSSWSRKVGDVGEVIDVSVVKPKAAFMTASDQRFYPERMATRAETAEAIYALFPDKSLGGIEKSFPDVPSTYPSYEAIQFCSSQGIMNGYPDGTFGPDRTLTRAELATVLVNFYELAGYTGYSFPDVDSAHWASSFIDKAKVAGMVGGYEDGSFRPENNVTRAELTTMVSNAEHRDLISMGENLFTDVPATHWAFRYIMDAAVAEVEADETK